MTRERIRVAVIGSGNIGIDLCERLLLDDDFELVALAGRRADSPGLMRFEGRVPVLTPDGIYGLLNASRKLDGVFDATSAFDHLSHWELIRKAGIWAVDLTPSRIGQPIVPSLIDRVPSMSIESGPNSRNFSMITCGGQSSAPLIHALALGAIGIEEIEISSSIAARSAGPATRRNIDQYIETTESLGQLISGCQNVKAILVLNPAEPPVMMRTTVIARAQFFDLEVIEATLNEIVSTLVMSVPGYNIVVSPYYQTPSIVSMTARVTGAGYYLPEYAGNLDIINAAAVETARKHAHQIQSTQSGGQR